MRCFALDLSHFVGWAEFATPTRKPRMGTFELPFTRGNNFGPVFHALDQWLDGMVTTIKPDLLAFEAPLTPIDGKSWHIETNARTVRYLGGLANIAELVAARRRVRCIEVTVRGAKARLTGNQYATKQQMKAACVRRGWLPADDHQADACGVALAAYDHVGETTP
jgi:Holliday junction resolvasome RuvABC endonuclease subunit